MMEIIVSLCIGIFFGAAVFGWPFIVLALQHRELQLACRIVRILGPQRTSLRLRSPELTLLEAAQAVTEGAAGILRLVIRRDCLHVEAILRRRSGSKIPPDG